MNNNTNPTKEQMYQWYVVEQKSYRQIMKITGIKNNRKIPKLLKQYGIEIRHGSDAVKTQWVNNDERRKNQSEFLSDAMKGKESHRQIPLSELKRRYKKHDIDVLEKHVIDHYTYLDCKCNVCGDEFRKALGNMSKGCLKCSIEKVHERQRVPFDKVQDTFSEYGLVLIDTEYKNAYGPLSFICPNHAGMGVQKRSLYGIKKTKGCSYCKIEKRQKEKGMSDRQKLKMFLDEWRISVFERDNFTCQCCGYDKGKILQAHHIKNFATHKHLRLDIDNGITLCKNCHNPNVKGSFHDIYGVHNNTEEQLKQYIEKKQASLV